MAGRLEGKVALISGGAIGIGEAIAKLFALEGAKVVIVGLESDPLAEVADEIGAAAAFVAADIATQAGAEKALAKVRESFGQLDILVNNAAFLHDNKPMAEITEDEFFHVVTNNTGAIFFLSKHAKEMLAASRGVIINTGSVAGTKGSEQQSVYAATKAWIHSFTQSTALAYAPLGIRVNAVAPGPIITRMTDPQAKETEPDANRPVEPGADTIKAETTPMGRRGTTQEVANVFLFLASTDASYVTGSIYHVDGGGIAGSGDADSIPDELKVAPEPTLDLRHEVQPTPSMMR